MSGHGARHGGPRPAGAPALRVLFTCAAGYGHLHPMVPLAGALAAAGHEPAFALPEKFCGRARAAGFRAFACGLGGDALRAEIGRRFPRPARDVPEGARSAFALVEIGARLAAPAMVDGLVDLVRAWHPDVIVHDPSELAGPIAAAVAGVPWVTHSWGASPPLEELRMAGDAVGPLWERFGVEPDELGGTRRHLYLDLCPPSLRGGDSALSPVDHPLRPVPFDAVGGEDLPAWVRALPALPTVYVTLGTMGTQAPGVYEQIIDGLSGEAVNVIVTVGPDRDPATLVSRPCSGSPRSRARIHVERYIPQSLILDRCDAVVTHGGSGSVLGALGQGLPLLVVPQAADQFHNAERVVACGAGRRLMAADLEARAVRREVLAVLDGPTFRRGAAAVGAEIDAMPPPERIVAVIEALVRGEAVVADPRGCS